MQQISPWKPPITEIWHPSSGYICQSKTLLSARKAFLGTSLNLLSCNLTHWFLALSSEEIEKIFLLCSRLWHCRAAIVSPHYLLWSIYFRFFLLTPQRPGLLPSALDQIFWISVCSWCPPVGSLRLIYCGIAFLVVVLLCAGMPTVVSQPRHVRLLAAKP